MKIVIWKYEPDKNFFDLPDLVDKMILTEIYEEGFPLYNEELNSDSDQLTVKCGDWEMTFSLLQTALSGQNKNIKQFFFDGNYRFLVGFTFTNLIGSWRWGIVRPDGITCEPSATRYKLKISAQGILKEWADKYSAMPASAVTGGNDEKTFDEYIENWLFGAGKVRNDLNIASHVGFMPKVSKPLQNGMIQSNTPRITIWKAFTEIAKCFGFMYKIVNPLITYPIEQYNHPPFQVMLFWITQNLGTENIEIVEDNFTEGYDLIGVNDYVAIPFVHGIYTGNVSTAYDSYSGFCTDKQKYSIYTPRGDNQSEIISNEPGGQFGIPVDGKNPTPFSKDSFFFYDTNNLNPIPINKLKRINVEFYFTAPVIINRYGYNHKFTFARIFVNRVNQYNPNNNVYLDEGFANIIDKTARLQYQFLLSGIKRYYELTTKQDMDTTLTVGSHGVVSFDSESRVVRCLKIRDFNIKASTANTYWVEV